MPMYSEELLRSLEDNWGDRSDEAAPASLPAPFKGDLGVDDAFSTILQWLYSRMEAIQGAADSS